MPIETKSAGGIVLNSRGEVLVVNQNNSSWSLPKGHINEGESALRAAIREIREESGLVKLDLIKELGTYKRYKLGMGGGDDKTEMKIITMFLFKTSETKLSPIDASNPVALWVSKNRVPDMLTHEKDKDFFRNAIKEC